MKSYLLFITLIFISLYFTNCSEEISSDREINRKAFKIIEQFDDSLVQVCHTWNYGTRGEFEIWTKYSGDSTEYSCFYNTKKDTAYLRLFDPYNFTQDFQCSLSFDTTAFHQFDFTMYNGKITRFSFVDDHGRDHITDTLVPVSDIFTANNPFDTLSNLSGIKNRLGVYGIVYHKQAGEFIEFWLSPQHKLTYLPDDLNLSPLTKTFWLDDFAQGKTIKKNWNLHKYEKPRDR